MSYIKTTAELDAIAEGGKRMGEILETLAHLVEPGVSAFTIDQEAERLIRKVGGVPAFQGYRGGRGAPPFPATICFCVNEELVHGIPSKDKVIHDGDLVSIDIGMRYPARNGFFTDTALTVAVGDIPEKTRALLRVTHDALEEGIRAALPGNTVADIGRAVETYVHSQGRYGIVRDLVGHGVGHAVHEEPRVPNYYDQSLEQWVLKPGVVIAIEPMITLGDYHVETASDHWTILSKDRSLSAHFEHTIIVREDGPFVATRRPSEV